MVIDGTVVRGEIEMDEFESSNANPEFMSQLNDDLKNKGFDIKLSAKRFNYKPTPHDAQDPTGQGYDLILRNTFIRETFTGVPESVFNATLTVEGGVPQVFNGVTINTLSNLINSSLTLPYISAKFQPEHVGNEETVPAQVDLSGPTISKLVTIDVTVVTGSITCQTLGVDAAIYANDSLSIPIYRPQAQPQTFGTGGSSAEYIPTQVYASGNVSEIYIPERKSNIGGGVYDFVNNDVMDLNTQVRFPITINLATRQTVLGYNRNFQLPDLDYKRTDSKVMIDYPYTDVLLNDQEGGVESHQIDNLNWDHVNTIDGRIPVKMFRFNVETPLWVTIDNVGGIDGEMIPFPVLNNQSNGTDFIWVSEDWDAEDPDPTSYTPDQINNDSVSVGNGNGRTTSYSRWMYPGYTYLFAATHLRTYGDISDSSFDIRTWTSQQ